MLRTSLLVVCLLASSEVAADLSATTSLPYHCCGCNLGRVAIRQPAKGLRHGMRVRIASGTDQGRFAWVLSHGQSWSLSCHDPDPHAWIACAYLCQT
jgi:hypothetical protein